MISEPVAVPPSTRPLLLASVPPFVWPDPRLCTGDGRYETLPPFAPLLANADLVSGMLVDVTDKTLVWLTGELRERMAQEKPQDYSEKEK